MLILDHNILPNNHLNSTLQLKLPAGRRPRRAWTALAAAAKMGLLAVNDSCGTRPGSGPAYLVVATDAPFARPDLSRRSLLAVSESNGAESEGRALDCGGLDAALAFGTDAALDTQPPQPALSSNDQTTKRPKNAGWRQRLLKEPRTCPQTKKGHNPAVRAPNNPGWRQPLLKERNSRTQRPKRPTGGP